MNIQLFNIKVIKLLLLLSIALNLTACVGLDRAVLTITNHTKHYSFTHADVVNGGVLVGGLIESWPNNDAPEGKDWSPAFVAALDSKRKKYNARSADPLIESIGKESYDLMINQYKADRWIDLKMMADIRGGIPERYVVFARIESISQSQSSSASKRKKKRKKDANGKETKEYVDGPDIYDVYRSSTRRTVISADVFDLAQDIIVWSGTRNGTETNRVSYKTDHYIGKYLYQNSYPYPDYPSWFDTFRESARGLVTHMPHKKD